MIVETEIQIAASPAKVWLALCDFSSYSRWNPFREVVGQAELGAKVTLLIGPDPKARHKVAATISLFEPGCVIGFRTGRRLFGIATESFAVEPSGSGTRLRHAVEMSGVNAWLMSRRQAAEGLRQVYQKVDKALQQHVAPGPRPSTSGRNRGRLGR